MSILIENPGNLFERAVILKLFIGKPGNMVQLDADQYQVDADKNCTKAEKELLKSPEVAKVIKRQEQLRSAITKLSVSRGQSPLGHGTYLLAIPTVLLAEDMVDATKADVARLLIDVKRMRPQRIEEARVALNGLFNAADYLPVDEYLGKFRIITQYLSFGAPAALAQVRDGLLEREQGKVAESTASSVQNVYAVLRGELKSYVDKFTARLAQADSGEGTKFKELLDNFTEFLTTLPLRNIVDDAASAALGADITQKLEGVTSDLIRENKIVRQSLAATFAGIQAQANDIVVSLRPTRQIIVPDVTDAAA